MNQDTVRNASSVIHRSAYMDGTCDHREYYRQFVNPFVTRMVERVITTERLLKSSDQQYFNDIALNRWDMMVSALWIMVSKDLLNQAGEIRSLGTGVCILKAAARQLVEGYCALDDDQ